MTKTKTIAPAPCKQDEELDFIDVIFQAAVARLNEDLSSRSDHIKKMLRKEFAGERFYISAKPRTIPEQERAVREAFNGRNASELARIFGVSRATIYRRLKT